MPVPPTSTEHEGHEKGEHPGDHDPDYKPKAGATQGKSESIISCTEGSLFAFRAAGSPRSVRSLTPV